MKILRIAVLLMFPLSVVTGQAAEKEKNNDKKTPSAGATSAEVTLESTVTGNREQPKVLYIVPWQAPDGPESLRQDFRSGLDDLFQPVEREAFLRQLKHKKAASAQNHKKKETVK